MPASMTVAVLNLLPGTTKRDVENHFSRLLVKSRPAVGPLVTYIKKKELVDDLGRRHTRSRAYIKRVATTVTFEGKSPKACERARERKLHASTFYPRGVPGKSSKISVKKEFLGMTPLNAKPDHEFDFVFLHGLQGHAFHSWALKKGGPSNLVMWPRDLLPDYLMDERGLCGRFWALGYNASPSDRASALTTIESAAMNLIILLNEHRDQALCMELGQKDKTQGAFLRNGKCIVKGITFFGTPFQGSPVADYMLPLAKVMGHLGRNESLIPSLGWKSPYLAQISGEFGQLQKHHGIDMRIFTENLPLYKRPIRFMVTDPESASGSFGKDIKPIPLTADHRNMIKFSGDRDDNWERVAEEIADMVTGAQSGVGLQPETATIDSEMSSLTDNPVSDKEEKHEGLGKVRSGSTTTHVRDFSVLPRPTMVERVLTATRTTKKSVQRRIARVLSAATGGRLDASIHKRFSDPVPDNPVVELNPDRIIVDRTISKAPPESIDATLYSLLSRVDTVFILDDSVSMKREDVPTRVSGSFMSRWQCLVEAIRTFGDIAARVDDDGVDVHFVVNVHLDEKGLTSGRQLLAKLQNIEPAKTPYLDNVLQRVLLEYVHRYSRNPGKEPLLKPLNVITITDGVTGDHEKVENTLVRVAKQLANLEAPSGQVGVQFVQIGFDESASAWLATLDDTLREMHGVRDIVDTVGFEANVQYGDQLQAYLRKVLLGGIDRSIDASNEVQDSTSPMRSLGFGHGQTF